MMEDELECGNCYHDESDHKEDTEGKYGAVGVTYCLGAGTFEDGEPQCDCDDFQPEDEDETGLD